ncbi:MULTISPECIES: cohesin domain-containing protein [Pigmentiphaga]|uniref:Cohesin domain-containing protein n=1 Tax=Pigmentiphaga daeguensis TaxID=414049 RepID=A0ABN1BH69_9BURK|nr:cohesin domain-containing protein [Pigmentiphaga sp. D-2]
MRIRSFILRSLLAGLPLAAAMSGTAHAQFVGDAFFVDPSVTAVTGAEGAIQVAVFSGTQAVGAAHATVTYDPAALEILAIDPVAAGRVTPAVQWRKDGNVLHIVMVNGTSLTQPIGTVPLGNIRFKVLGPARATTTLTAKATEILMPDATAIPPGLKSYDGEVTFVEAVASPMPRLAGLAQKSSSPDLVERARRMRPAGGTVTLQVPNGSGQAQPVEVRIPAATVPRE